MGRLTLNVLLSFAQFEREVIGERVRDKIAASKRKGIWVGGPVPLGYRSVDKKLEDRARGGGGRPQDLRRTSRLARSALLRGALERARRQTEARELANGHNKRRRALS